MNEAKSFYCWTNDDGEIVVSRSNTENRNKCLSIRYTPGTMMVFWAQSEGEAKSIFRQYLPKKGR